MAGGAGTRFWPYSRTECPKQFLDFFGTGRTLLQMTVDRFRPVIPVEHILIVTNVAYKQLILQQIPDLKPEQVLCEPCRRNTAPCIAYAIWRIAAQTEEANIVIAASDHLILQEDKFRKTIVQGLDFVSQNEVLLTLGMKPTRPETGYGYIEVADNSDATAIHPVTRFCEKPDLQTAQRFLKAGNFLWNSGMFLWNLQSIMNALYTYLPEVMAVFEEGRDTFNTFDEEDFIRQNFARCPSISIDYGVMEKAENVYVLSADFGWSDVGTWGSLYNLSDKDNDGNVSLHSEAHFYDSHRNIVTLESGKLAVIEGLDDYIIAENKGVLLICKKSDEQNIRDFVADAADKYK